ncbi:MAG: type II toxin-antitoxin system TacA family antitoxin [Acidiferrobacteraceae bacterium]
MTASARFDLKLKEDEKELFAQAAALMGTTTAGFVRAAAKEKARMLVEQEIRVTLSAQDFAKLTMALDKPFAPNKALRGALKGARQTVHRA